MTDIDRLVPEYLLIRIWFDFGQLAELQEFLEESEPLLPLLPHRATADWVNLDLMCRALVCMPTDPDKVQELVRRVVYVARWLARLEPAVVLPPLCASFVSALRR